MSLYRSYIPVKLSDKCIISFDVDFNENEATMVGFGIHESSVKSINSLDKSIFIDNKWLALDKSTKYKKDTSGNYLVKKKTDNSEFFDYKLWIDETTGKVYEEIKNGENFDINVDTDWVEFNKVLYKHFPGKYIYEDGAVKLNMDYVDITAFYIMSKGEVKLEKYIFNSDMQTYKGRYRFVVADNGTVIDVSKLNVQDNMYESVITALYSDTNDNAYVYLTYEGITPKNFLINYRDSSDF